MITSLLCVIILMGVATISCHHPDQCLLLLEYLIREERCVRRGGDEQCLLLLEYLIREERCVRRGGDELCLLLLDTST